METIRSFIYLDNEKMYSLASQLFEGLVERIIESDLSEKQEEESQKGPRLSGQYLADIIKFQKERKEDKFLHDYLYSQFEEELKKKNKLIEINESNIENLIPYKIVKIKGRLTFNDAKEIINTIKQFNNLGEAIAYMTLFSQKQQLEQQTKQQINQIQDRNQKVKAIQKSSSSIKNNIKTYALENGLNLEKEFLDKLEYTLNYGLDNLFEVQMNLNDKCISSILNRDNLKENEKLIINKYSRNTEKEFYLIGIVTQSSSYELSSKPEETSKEFNFREAFRNMVDKLIDVENVFMGKSKGEIIIDPIAIYIEV